MCETEYSAAERAAYKLLRGWLHTASVRFMRAHGRVPRVSIPAVSLEAVAPKRSLPRFAHGWDSQQQHGPINIIDNWQPRSHSERLRIRPRRTLKPKPKPKPQRHAGNTARLIPRPHPALREPWLSMELGRLPPEHR